MGQSKIDSLLVERCLAFCGRCEITFALVSTRGAHALVLKLIVARFTLYRAIYGRLEKIGCTIDASKCFRQMVDELVEYENAHDEQFQWVFGEWSCIRCMYH